MDLALYCRVIIEKHMLLGYLVTTRDLCHSLGSLFLIYSEAKISFWMSKWVLCGSLVHISYTPNFIQLTL